MIKKLSRKNLLLILGLISIGIIIYLCRDFILLLFTDSAKMKQYILSYGHWSILIFILLQVLQILIAPIPGQAVGLVAGGLFGVFWGTVYSMIGAFIGFSLVFLLARKLGKPFVEKIVDKKVFDKFNYLMESKGVLALFIIYLLPVFPDDLISYIAGLSKISLKKLILISLLGRFPGYLGLAIIGAGISTANAYWVIGVLSVSILSIILVATNIKKIERSLEKINKKK